MIEEKYIIRFRVEDEDKRFNPPYEFGNPALARSLNSTLPLAMSMSTSF